MSFSLNNVTTSNGYTAATTLRCPGSARLNLDVANATIVFQVGVGQPSPVWDSAEITQFPSFKSRDRLFDWVRVRSAVAGVAAQVNVEAASADEIG